VPPDQRNARFASARACGTVLYVDRAAMIVAPSVAR
jgi:hypothetical protein